MKWPEEGTIADIIRLSLGAAGFASLSFGAWLVYPPAGFITGGVILLIIALIGGLRAR